MKQYTICILSAIMLTFLYCKPTKKSTAPEPVVSAAAVDSAAILQMSIAQRRWPNTVAEELKEGQVIYSTKCTRCHKAYNIPRFSEAKWLHEIDDMSPKAKLIPEEKLKLTKYILSYRETKETLRQAQGSPR